MTHLVGDDAKRSRPASAPTTTPASTPSTWRCAEGSTPPAELGLNDRIALLERVMDLVGQVNAEAGL